MQELKQALIHTEWFNITPYILRTLQLFLGSEKPHGSIDFVG
jgi:hypothetical protein